MATAVAYAVQGLCFGVVITRVSVLQDKFHLSNSQLTIVLLIVPVIAGVGSVASGPLAARLGGRAVLRAGGIAGVAGGPAGWRAAFAAPLVLTVVIMALACSFAPRTAPAPADLHDRVSGGRFTPGAG